METINERIKYIIDQYYNGTVSNFAKEVGVTQSNNKMTSASRTFAHASGGMKYAGAPTCCG